MRLGLRVLVGPTARRRWLTTVADCPRSLELSGGSRPVVVRDLIGETARIPDHRRRAIHAAACASAGDYGSEDDGPSTTAARDDDDGPKDDGPEYGMPRRDGIAVVASPGRYGGPLRLEVNTVSLSPGLYLVSTPIGSLADVTLRALSVLASADVVLAEDTRTTRRLLGRYGLRPPRLMSLHAHNERGRAGGDALWEGVATRGVALALVSDAGTPAVADPGALLVAEAARRGVPVWSVPGPSAAASAVAASGLNCPAPMDRSTASLASPLGQRREGFSFHGFLPPKVGARRALLQLLLVGAAPPPGVILGPTEEAGARAAAAVVAAASPECAPRDACHVFFVPPHAAVATLRDVAAVAGDGRRVSLSREISKRHEEHIRRAVESSGAVLA